MDEYVCVHNSWQALHKSSHCNGEEYKTIPDIQGLFLTFELLSFSFFISCFL